MIEKVQLDGFRNFTKRLFRFSSDVTVVVGPNASGKTNLLEAINLMASGKSYRARVEEEMINYTSDIARVKCQISNDRSQKSELEVDLTRGEIEVGERYEKAPRKKLKINGVNKRLIDFAGNLKVVLFGPHDLGLVTESPSTRRNFLDFVISQVDREYRRASLSYAKGLRQRNKLLLGIRDEAMPAGRQGLSRNQLLFWDKLLIKNGDYISRARENFIDFVNGTGSFDEHLFSLDYDKSVISEARLEQYKKEEVAAATTLVGPHRDDFIFRVEERESRRAGEGRELARYGSRGEQRMGVLWLKIAEMSYLEEKSEEQPTLLLDDIFSELDSKHREIVLDVAKGRWHGGASGQEGQQTIITTADPHYVEKLKGVERIDINGS